MATPPLELCAIEKLACEDVWTGCRAFDAAEQVAVTGGRRNLNGLLGRGANVLDRKAVAGHQLNDVTIQR
jgi:hypothetical protein